MTTPEARTRRRVNAAHMALIVGIVAVVIIFEMGAR